MWIVLSMLEAHAGSELDVGLYGDMLTHPGITTRDSASFARTRGLSARIEGQALAYWHPGLMTAAQLRVGPALRLVGPREGTWGVFVHAGISHGWWTSPTFEAVGSEVRRVPLAGDTWFVCASGLELGRQVDAGPISGWAVRPQLGLRIPTFHGVGIDLAVEGTARLGGRR